MVQEPNTQQEIFEGLQDRIIGRSEKITHFQEGSLNHTLGYHGYAGYFSRYEHALLAVQLAGWVDYSGGPIGEDDLIQLEIDPERVNLEWLNSHMDDSDLDELAARDGITRDPGDHAEGEVLFLTVSDDVVIPEGTRVTTAPDRFAETRREYLVTEESTPETGTTGVLAPVEAVEIGPHYNVGPGAIENVPAPPPGVRDVTNQDPIAGGESEETNTELRERVKNNITYQSGGGTTDGIIGGLVTLIDGLDRDDVFIQEHYNPPGGANNWVEVTVDGGDDRIVEEAIDSLHPTGIEHVLNRPTRYYVDVSTTLAGSPINVDRVESAIARYFSERGIGEDVNRAQLIKAIMNSDDDIENITSLELHVNGVGDIEGDFVVDPDEKAQAGAINVGT